MAGVLAVLAGGAMVAPAADPSAPTPEELVRRWIECTREADRPGIEGLFPPGASLTFAAEGRSRLVDPRTYGELLAAARGKIRSIEREPGAIEVSREEGTRGTVVRFPTSDRIETLDGWTIRAENDEEFEYAVGDSSRPVCYRSKTISVETVRKPEEWMRYGGPFGLNGFLLQAHFEASPPGMWLWAVGGVAACVLLAVTVRALGFRRGR
jgi:hypothetical protein